MAIVRMAKFVIVSHHTEAAQLLEVLQGEGICQILNAEEAMISKDAPELAAAGERPKETEDLLNRLQKCIAFLKGFGDPTKALVSMLAPRVVVDERAYEEAISDEQALKIIDQSEQLAASIEKAASECESLRGTLAELRPWQSLQTPVEEIGPLDKTICQAGLLPAGHFKQIQDAIGELGGAIQQVGETDNRYACLVVYLKEAAGDVQKLLRSAEFAPVNFAPLAGTAAELIEEYEEKLSDAESRRQSHIDSATKLSEKLLKLEILSDHYTNLLNREQTKGTAPATQRTVLLEGWVKEKNYPRLEEIVSGFGASSLSRVEPAEGEDIPVEIENKQLVRPFEVITRLYGMPRHVEVDPTVFLAPFFALFFGLCLTDAGYGLAIIALMILLAKKIQGDKKLMFMLGACAAVTVGVGALTGGWFGNAVQEFMPALQPVRARLMWFDPLEQPMIFFGLALGVGYIQILTGLVIAFAHNLKRRDYIAAVCDQLTWLIMLNCLVIFLLGWLGIIPARIGGRFLKPALVPAVAILLFSHREGGVAARLGMGLYNLFSTIFFMGDVLSYLRLMALGMVTGGLAMAINIIAKIALDIPYGLGIVAMILVLIGGHGFNLAINALGAFVHTLRLQYVEFFPKFIVGGGRAFQPLSKQYRHIYIAKRAQ